MSEYASCLLLQCAKHGNVQIVSLGCRVTPWTYATSKVSEGAERPTA
jgi:hypothetical protein